MNDVSHSKSEAENIDRIWELSKDIRTCMLVSWDGSKQRARPMSAHVFQDRHAIYFLDKHNSPKEQQISQYPEIILNFVKNDENKYVTITGRASISNDRALIKELWSDFYKAWYDSENDPSIRVIIFTPESAELWDSPNMIAAGALMLVAAVTGAKPSFGENAKVSMR